VQNISLTVNSLYDIEYLHPWQTVKIRNLWLNIVNATIQNVRYQYEQATIMLEYYTTIWQQIFNS
jgi:lysozyme family protein